MHCVQDILPVLVVLLLCGDAAPADGPTAKNNVAPPVVEVAGEGIQIAPGGIIPAQGQVTVTAAAAFAGGGGTMSVDDNGVKQFETEEYGKKIKITDDPQKGIRIECVQKKGGTDETKNYEAKDAQELEKKHPEGFKVYQRYLGNQAPGAGIVVVQGNVPAAPGQPLPMPGQPFPMPGGGLQIVPAVPGQIQGQLQLAGPAAGNVPIEAAITLMGQLSEEIKTAAKTGAWKDASKESKAAIKKQADELKKQLSELQKQLGEK
jgi:hypothetical protein